jgi:hypothetical protein
LVVRYHRSIATVVAPVPPSTLEWPEIVISVRGVSAVSDGGCGNDAAVSFNVAGVKSS